MNDQGKHGEDARAGHTSAAEGGSVDGAGVVPEPQGGPAHVSMQEYRDPKEMAEDFGGHPNRYEALFQEPKPVVLHTFKTYADSWVERAHEKRSPELVKAVRAFLFEIEALEEKHGIHIGHVTDSEEGFILTNDGDEELHLGSLEPTSVRVDPETTAADSVQWSVRVSVSIEDKFGKPLSEVTLADVARIRPVDWCQHMSPFGLREMDKRFKDLGVEWPGEWPKGRAR